MEIVNVDSATIYRGMDIGTAKPSPAEQARVPQHLLDILDPAQSYSAAEFRADALRLIDEIRARGRVPLLAGGTMMYYKRCATGWTTCRRPTRRYAPNWKRARRREGWPALHAELATLDPITAARLAPNDSQRIQRALEICRLSGQPMSALLLRAQRAGRGRQPVPDDQPGTLGPRRAARAHRTALRRHAGARPDR